MGVSMAARGLVLSIALVVAAGAASAQEKLKFTMGLSSTSFAVLSPRIAQEMGLFDKHGLAANFVVMDNGSAATAGVIANSIDLCTGGSGEFMSAQVQGQDVIPIMTVYTGYSGSLVLSKTVAKKLPVSSTAPVKDRLKALDGLVIASTSPTGAYTLAFKGAMAGVGGNIRFTYMAQPAMEASLESGAIQGFIGGAPFWALPIVRGSGVLWLSGPGNEMPPENVPPNTTYLLSTRAFATKNPDLVKRLKAVFLDLGQAVQERPAEVKAVVARLNPAIEPATLDLLLKAEINAWKTRPITAQDMAREIAYVKAGGGGSAERIDKIDPASLLLKD